MLGNFLTSWEPVSFSRRALLHGVNLVVSWACFEACTINHATDGVSQDRHEIHDCLMTLNFFFIARSTYLMSPQYLPADCTLSAAHIPSI